MRTPFLLAFLMFPTFFSLQNEHDGNEAFMSMLVSEYTYGAFARNQAPEKIQDTNEWLEKFGGSLNETSDLKQVFDDFGTKEMIFNSRSQLQEDFKIGWGILKVNVTMNETGLSPVGKIRAPYIFVAFKGTSDCQDVICDFKWSKHINPELQTECHYGINELFVKYHLEETVLEELRKMHNKMSDEEKLETQIILTGHSLGGGVAQILGAYFKSKSYLASDRFTSLISHNDKNHPNLSGQDRFVEMLMDSKIYSIASPQIFTDIHADGSEDSPAQWDWTNLLGNSSFHYVNQHDPVVEFNILQSKDDGPYSWVEYGDIYYWTNGNRKFEKIDFEKLKKMSKTKSELVLQGIFNTKYHFMRTYLTHFAMQENEAITNHTPDSLGPALIVIILVCAGCCCFLGSICAICFACGRCSKKSKHQSQPKEHGVDAEIIAQP